MAPAREVGRTVQEQSLNVKITGGVPRHDRDEIESAVRVLGALTRKQSDPGNAVDDPLGVRARGANHSGGERSVRLYTLSNGYAVFQAIQVQQSRSLARIPGRDAAEDRSAAETADRENPAVSPR
jgi:hypothetical protein